MLKKFLTCCALMLVMICAVSTTAFARPTELTMVEAFEQDSETLRVEISYRGDKLDASNVSTELKSGILRVDLDNTLPGRVSRISGTKINADVADFVEKIYANKLKDRGTTVKVYLRSYISEDVNVSFEPANRSEKKSARVVLTVKKNSSAPDNQNNFNGDGRVIVIDPGHGGSDAGAIGPNGVTEKSVALAVSLKAQKLLANAGYNVVMTRTTDIDVAAPGVSDATELQARVNKAPPSAELFISVHCNAFSNSNAHGMETYHAPGAIQGARLARLLNEELERLGGLSNRGVKAARFYVMTHSRCAASLIELGFITNPREELLLADEDYQQQLAQAITNAVNRYFNQGGLD